jgi:hypothetical protein
MRLVVEGLVIVVAALVGATLGILARLSGY